MLLDQEVSNWIVDDQCLYRLVISFDGAREKTLEQIRRGANYHTILKNVEYLSSVKRQKRKIVPSSQDPLCGDEIQYRRATRNLSNCRKAQYRRS